MKFLQICTLLIIFCAGFVMAAAPDYVEQKDIVFKTVGDREIKLNLYLPDEKSAKKRSLLIWVHGGAWRRGSKDYIVDKNPLLLTSMIREGYALASVDYRLSGEASFPDPVADVHDAINFLHDNADKYNIDVDNIVLMGRSSGGHLAALVGAVSPHNPIEFYTTQPKYKVPAVVSFFGPTDILKLSDKRKGKGGGGGKRSPEAMFLGADPKQEPELAKRASPTHYINADSPAFILLHGDQDKRVPHSQSVMLKALLDQHGVDNKLFIEEGVGHSARIFDSEKYVPEVIEFVKKHLPPK